MKIETGKTLIINLYLSSYFAFTASVKATLKIIYINKLKLMHFQKNKSYEILKLLTKLIID
jgi:hypothetical protein